MPLTGPLKTTRLKAIALIAAALLGSSTASAQVIFKALLPSTKPIASETVQALEKLIVLPAEAAPLTNYDRYYAPGILEKREVIVGVFLKRPVRMRDGAQPLSGFLSAYTTTIEKLPRIPGGRCNVVTLYFDVTNESFIKLPAPGKEPQAAVCNGLR